jgi:hypothetical protein
VLIIRRRRMPIENSVTDAANFLHLDAPSSG